MGMYERIKDLSKSKNLSVNKLEKILGFGNSTISNWNNSAPSIERVYKVATFFDVTPHYIYTGETNAHELTAEQKKILSSYAQLDTKQQAILKNTMYNFTQLNLRIKELSQQNAGLMNAAEELAQRNNDQ